MAREYFKAFHSYLDAIELLGDAERGRLFTALLEYSSTGAASHLSGNERFIFPLMRAAIDREIAAYEATVSAGSESGRKGGRPKKKSENPYPFSKTPTLSENPYPFSKTQDKDKDKDKDKEDTLLSPPARERVDYQAVVELFNKVCTSLPSVRSLSDARKKAVSARMSEIDGDMDELRHTLELVEQSDFLSGRSGAWQASFDWIFKAANWQKIREGNYKNRGGVSGGDARGDSADDPWAFLDDSAI